MTEIRKISQAATIGLLNLGLFGQARGITAKRELEKTGTLYLLAQLLETPQFELAYTDVKKPFLVGRPEHISISHSHDQLAVIVNTREPAGIDIELIRNKVLLITHKYMSADELAVTGNMVERLIVYWAAKETLYKVHGLKGLDFKTHLLVEELGNDELLGHIRLPNRVRTYRLKKERIGNYIMVYSQHEVQ